MLVSLGAALVFGASAWAWLRRASHPLFDLSLFAQPRFAGALLIILLGYFAFSGVSFVVAQCLQVAREIPAFEAGLLSLPLTVCLLLGTLLAPGLTARWGAERALLLSLGVAVLAAVLLVVASQRPTPLLLCLALAPFGGGCGSAFATATELTLGAVAPERAASAAAVSESAFEFGGVLGVAVLSTLLGTASLSREVTLHGSPLALGTGAGVLLLSLLIAVRLANRRSRLTPSACCDHWS